MERVTTHTWRWRLMGALWAMSLVTALGAVHWYGATPGTAGVTPSRWPDGSMVGLSEREATVVVFVHPECVCTPATIENLRGVLQDHHAAVYVVASGPAVEESDDVRPTRWAARLGATLVRDGDGVEARAMGARVSGHVVVAARDGRILFSGGVTPGRGHVGACDGLRRCALALERAEGGSESEMARASVFGCDLFDPAPCRPDASACNPVGADTREVETKQTTSEV